MNVKRIRLSSAGQRVLVILLGIAVLELGMTRKLGQLINLALHDSAADASKGEAKPSDTTRAASPPVGEPGGIAMPPSSDPGGEPMVR